MEASTTCNPVPGKYEHLPEALVHSAEQYVRDVLDTEDPQHDVFGWYSPGWSDLWQRLLGPGGLDILGDGGNGTRPGAEETGAWLIRKGVPRTAVKAVCNHTTITLTCGRYRIYRETSGQPAGSFRILAPGMSPVFEPALPSRELADLILAIEAALPGMMRAMEDLDKGMKNIEKRRLARKRAGYIERLTVQRLVEEALTPLGISCSFEVKDGVVSLSLTKTLQAEFEVPFGELQALLSDTERIESSLTPMKTDPISPHSFGSL